MDATALFLVARGAEKLNKAAQALRASCHVEVLVYPVDLSLANGPQLLRNFLVGEGIKISALINNAGPGYFGAFAEDGPPNLQRCVDLNCRAVATLCSLFYGDLALAKDGLVINVSSAAAYQPIPGMATYAATKSFVHSLSQALNHEWKDSGIYVQTLVPFVLREVAKVFRFQN